MDKTDALLTHMRSLAEWLEIQAREFDSGNIRSASGGEDDAAEMAASYRHKLRNIEAVVQAYRRLRARETA